MTSSQSLKLDIGQPNGFSAVTETPLTRATANQLQSIHTRYELAARYAAGKDVLEVACGAGIGLGMIARVARRTVGGDVDASNCAIAQQTYRGRQEIQIKQFPAEELPFPDAFFDLVILYEAIYYLNSVSSFLREARRVLRPGSTLLVSTVNCRWAGFNPSPFSVRYLDGAELVKRLSEYGFCVSLLGGFPDEACGVSDAALQLIRKTAIALHLIPRTMKGKEWLKRLAYGRLKPIPADLSDIAPCNPVPLDRLEPPFAAASYRFLYAIATLPAAC